MNAPIRSTFRLVWTWFFALLVLASQPGCRDKPDPSPGMVTQTALTGVVIDEQNRPIADAAVSVGTATATSDAFGRFSIAQAAVADGRCVVSASKTGYFTAVRGMAVYSSTASTMVMLVARGTPQNVSGQAGGSTTNRNLRIDYPAAGFAQNGTAVTGTVQAYVRYISPTDPNLSNLMPGGDFAGTTTEGARRQLVTFGAVSVDLEANGQPVQLAAGKTATISFPAGTSTAPRIPLWHLDEATGIWKQEGEAVLQGNQYVGTVGRFSAWNLDIPETGTAVEGILTDCNNQPIRSAQVRIGQQSAYTSPQGQFALQAVAGQPQELSVFDGTSFVRAASLDALTEGERKNLGKVSICLPTITGTLVGCNGAEGVADIQVLGPNNNLLGLTQSARGAFNVFGQAGQTVTIRFIKSNDEVVTRQATFPASSAQPVNLGQIDVCVQGSTGGRQLVGFTINGDGWSNQRIRMQDDPIFSGQPQGSKDGTQTIIVLSRTTDQGQVTLGIDVPGTTTGTYTTDATLTVFIARAPSGAQSNYMPTDNNDVTVNITQYDAVGGRIKGTFSARLAKIDGSTVTPNAVTITQGEFDVLRTPDL